ncbi:hypothetical protein ACLOJK_005184 [Asimina triloba]
MRGLGRRMGEEKRRGLEGGRRLVAGGGGRTGKTHGRGEEKGTRGRQEGWEDALERRREGDLGAVGGWLLEGARGLGRRTREENRRGLEGGGRLVAGGGGRAGKTARERRREGDDGCRLLGDDGWERRWSWPRVREENWG